MDARRRAYIGGILRRGPTEAGYAFFRARRRRRNRADEELELAPGDRLALSGALDLEPADLEANARALENYAAADSWPIESLQWFVPAFHHAAGGGVATLLRLADHLARTHGVANRFSVYDRRDPEVARVLSARIAAAHPALAGAPVTPAGAALPGVDAAIATTWTSAFPLVRHRRACAKFFLVQDLEPAFHPAGSLSALLGFAGGLGLPGLVNTPGLADAYRALGSPAMSFRPAVDRERYHPPAGGRPGGGPARVFFYGRPATARNAFGLGLATLRRVKERWGERVEIVCAGEDWSPGQYGVADVLENRGMLESPDAVAELYRSCDIGLVFMLTRHPSYQPLEFMASGVATVTNANPATAWLLRHEDNALLADPLPALVAEQVSRLVEDAGLRARIAAAGAAEVSATTWPEQLERVWGAMTKAGPAFTLERETA